MRPGHGIRIINCIEAALAEKIAESRVIEEGRIKERSGVTSLVHQLEETLCRNAFDGEGVEILNRIKRSEGGKAGVDGTSEAREKVREKFHSLFVFGKQRLGFFVCY